MKCVSTKIALLAALFSLSPGLLSAQNIEKTGESPVEAKFSPDGEIRMDICPSGAEVVGTDEHVVRVDYQPMRDDVKVRLQVSGDRADLRVTGCPHNNFKITIEVPRSSTLYVRMFAGQMLINSVTGDKDVELDFGRLSIDVGKTDDIARVDASVNSGSLQATAFGVSKGGLFRSFEQKRPGKYRVHAHIGAGQIELH